MQLRTFAWRSLAALVLACSLPALSQTPVTLPNLVVDDVGAVVTMDIAPDGGYVFGGIFRKVLGTPRSGLAKVTSTGGLVTGFNPMPNGSISKVVVSGTNAFVAGDFTQIGGLDKSYLVKLSTVDGTVDSAFNPAPDSKPLSVAVDSGGNVYAAGTFTTIGGMTGRKIVKLDPVSGSAVGAWNPSFSIAFDMNAISLAVNGAWLYVSGSVACDINGYSGQLLRIDLASGVVDSAWTPAAAASNGGGLAFAFDPAGNVFAGGFPNLAVLQGTVNSCTPQTPLPIVNKLDAVNGATVSAFSPSGLVSALSMATDATGLYLVTGIPTSASPLGGGVGNDGNAFFKIVKLDLTSGSQVWASSTVDVAGGAFPSLLTTPSSLLVAGGDYLGFGISSPGLAALDKAAGTQLPGFITQVLRPGFGLRTLVAPDGKIYFGGQFRYLNGQPRNGLARLNADGSLDTSWTAGVDGSVFSMLLAGSALYVGGYFTNSDGTPRVGAAKFDTATGVLDGTWNPNVAGSTRAIVADGTGIYLAGLFDGAGGASKPWLAKVSLTNGSLDTGFNPSVNTAVPDGLGLRALALDGGFLIVAGAANPLLVGSNPRNIARLNTTTGAADTSWDPNPDGNVRALLVDGSNLYVGGSFSHIAGSARNRLARLVLSTGLIDSTWNPGTPAPTTIFSLTKSATDLYAGGTDGSLIASISRHGLASGTRDGTWSPAFTGSLFAGAYHGAVSADGSSILFAVDTATPREGLVAYSTAPLALNVAPAIAAGKSHTLALDATGKVYAWGSDSHGQLGQGRAINRPTPAQVAGLPTISRISLSGHVLAVDSLNQVWSWGDNSCGGQLGPRESSVTSKPSRVIGATGVIRVAAGKCFSLALKSDGTVWGWGLVPGYGTDTGLRQLAGLSGITDIAAGSTHALALSGGGAILVFGDNSQGQLGLGTTGGALAATPLPALAGVTAIAAGDVTSMALSGGQPYFWGRHADQTLITSPLALPGLGGTAVSISVTGNRPLVARSDGAVLGFNAATPSWVADVPGYVGITKVAAGAQGFSLGIDGAGALFAGGSNTAGQLGQGDTGVHASVVGVPLSGVTMVCAGAFNPSVVALKSDGTVWFWGAETLGESGDGGAVGSSVPLLLTIPATIKAIAAGDRFSAALDTTGQVWGWGDNGAGAFGSSLVNLSTPAVIGGVSNVAAIAAGGPGLLLYLLNDGTVQKSGTLNPLVGSPNPTALSGPGGPISGMVSLAAGDNDAYLLRNDGNVFALGLNANGELGNGTTTSSATLVPIQGISGTVTAISAARSRAGAVTSDGKVWTWGAAPLGNGSSAGSLTAVQVPGITDAADISVGTTSTFVRRQNGGILAWGNTGLADAANQNTLLPYAVAFQEPVQAVRAGAGNSLGFIIGNTGLAWGFGFYGTASTDSASIGDGTFVLRDRPVVLLAAGGAGNIDTNDWYLDLDPASPETIPAPSAPKTLGVSHLSGSGAGLSFDATIKYKSADFGKSINNYVFALVPAEFFGIVKSAPGTPTVAKLKAKSGGLPVLAQLTPAGWATVTGQLIAYSQGVADSFGGATNILNGIDSSVIPGARFCIGYGENSGSMLSFEALREVLLLEGASSNASGVPCVLTGIYVDGLPSSRTGTAVTFKASVVGLSPTGSVQFLDGANALLGPVVTTGSNQAVSSASITLSSLALGVHSISAGYSGDSLNAAVSSEVPLLHEVVTAPPGQSVVSLSGPTSSDLGSQVVFSAAVAGDAPTGTVQFKDGVANLGNPVPLVGGLATVRASSLALGAHSITAAYSGDSANAPAVSSAIAHNVYSVFATTVALTSSLLTSSQGDSVTLTATVTGSNPTGNVTFRDGSNVIGTAPVVNGVATITVSTFDAGQHVITAQYAGDANNQAVSSGSVFEQVNALPTDTVPNLFAFVDQGNVFINTVITSNAVTIGGIGAPSPVTVTGGAYSIGCNGTFTTVGGFITNGQTVCVQHTSSASPNTATHTLLTIGGVGATFTSTTAASAFQPGITSLVTHYYQSILRRSPDAGGQSFWESEALRVSGLGANVNETFYAMAMNFYFSAEYAAFARNDTDFVTDLYNTFFNRTPDGAGLAFWTGQLGSGLPREVALAAYMFSAEFANFTQAIFGNTAARAEVNVVVDFYRGLLSRLPDTSGFNFWVQQFRAAQCQGGAAVNTQVEAISSAYANSAEYAARSRTNAQYVGDLYNAFLRRGGDLAGVQFWISQVATGAQTREAVRRQFVASPEFQARVAAVIAQGCLP